MKPSGCERNSRIPIVRSANPIISEFLLVNPTFEVKVDVSIRLWCAMRD